MSGLISTFPDLSSTWQIKSKVLKPKKYVDIDFWLKYTSLKYFFKIKGKTVH